MQEEYRGPERRGAGVNNTRGLRMRTLNPIRAVIFSCFIVASTAYAQEVTSAGEHSDVLVWIIGGLCMVLFTICCFILNKVDGNQTRLFEFHAAVEKRLTIVETKCDMNHEDAHPKRRAADQGVI